jgi:hypothetical protein
MATTGAMMRWKKKNAWKKKLKIEKEGDDEKVVITFF